MNVASRQVRLGEGDALARYAELRREDSRNLGSSSVFAKSYAVIGVGIICALWGAAVVFAEWNALFVGLALLACVLILVDFRMGVVLLILLMPMSYSQIFPRQIAGVPGLNPVNLLLMGTLGSFLVSAFWQRTAGRFVPRPLLWLYIVPFLVAGVIGSRHVGEIPVYFFIAERVDFVNAAGYLRDMVVKPLFLVIFALLVGAAVARSKSPEKFVLPMLASIWIISLMVVLYFVQSGATLGRIAGSTEREFLSPLGMHANELGRMYATAFGILLFTWPAAKDYGLKMLVLGTMAIVVVALMLTFSRASFAGVMLITALFLVSRRNIAGLLFGAIAVVGVLFVLPDAVYERMAHGFGGGANAISAGRIQTIWLPLIPDLLQSPFWGHGIGSMLWSEAVRTGRSALVTHPHNAYLQTLLDMGLIGLVLVGGYYFHVWKSLRALGSDTTLGSDQRAFLQGAAAALLAFLAMAIADGSLTPRPHQVFLWMAIGMMYGLRARGSAG